MQDGGLAAGGLFASLVGCSGGMLLLKGVDEFLLAEKLSHEGPSNKSISSLGSIWRNNIGR